MSDITEQGTLLEQLRSLRNAIIAHRSQKADDRCIEDDDRLYEALGDGVKCDRRVGDKEALRYRKCEGCGYIEKRIGEFIDERKPKA